MSLPAGGEVSAVLRADPDVESIMVGSTNARFIATGSLTDGHFGLFRWDMVAQAGGATPHYHRGYTDSFFVLSGRPSFYNGADWLPAGPGDFLFVPQRGIHGFRNLEQEPASMLILFTPAPAREEYFRELADIIASGRKPSEEEWADLYARHDQVMV